MSTAPTVMTTLANGLRVVLAEDHTVPVVFLNWTAAAGFECDPPGREGLASMTPLLFREGSARRSRAQISEALDDLGATWSAGSDWDCAFVNLAVLSSDLAAAADLLIEMACRSTFGDEAVRRLRRARLAELDRRRADARAIASDEFARALWGDTIYGRAALGTPTTVERIEAADIASFHDAHYRPSASCVTVAGSFDPERVTDRLGSLALPPRRPLSPVARTSAPAAEPPPGVTLVDVPHATQTEIRMGHLGVAHDCRHLPALELLNAILGSGPGSRLARSLRRHLGLAYHVRSRVTARRYGGTFTAATSVAHDAAGAAVAAIRREIQRLCDELVPAAEIAEARERLLGARLRFQQDLIGTALKLGPAALRHDAEERERESSEPLHIEPAALRELARRYLHPERLVAVVVGPAAAWASVFSSEVAHGCAPIALESTS